MYISLFPPLSRSSSQSSSIYSVLYVYPRLLIISAGLGFNQPVTLFRPRVKSGVKNFSAAQTAIMAPSRPLVSTDYQGCTSCGSPFDDKEIPGDPQLATVNRIVIRHGVYITALTVGHSPPANKVTGTNWNRIGILLRSRNAGGDTGRRRNQGARYYSFPR